jgi:hypothetical protein
MHFGAGGRKKQSEGTQGGRIERMKVTFLRSGARTSATPRTIMPIPVNVPQVLKSKEIGRECQFIASPRGFQFMVCAFQPD